MYLLKMTFLLVLAVSLFCLVSSDVIFPGEEDWREPSSDQDIVTTAMPEEQDLVIGHVVFPGEEDWREPSSDQDIVTTAMPEEQDLVIGLRSIVAPCGQVRGCRPNIVKVKVKGERKNNSNNEPVHINDNSKSIETTVTRQEAVAIENDDIQDVPKTSLTNESSSETIKEHQETEPVHINENSNSLETTVTTPEAVAIENEGIQTVTKTSLPNESSSETIKEHQETDVISNSIGPTTPPAVATEQTGQPGTASFLGTNSWLIFLSVMGFFVFE